MAFKLIEAAQDRWRSVNGSYLVALVRAGSHASLPLEVVVDRLTPVLRRWVCNPQRRQSSPGRFHPEDVSMCRPRRTFNG